MTYLGYELFEIWVIGDMMLLEWRTEVWSYFNCGILFWIFYLGGIMRDVLFGILWKLNVIGCGVLGWKDNGYYDDMIYYWDIIENIIVDMIKGMLGGLWYKVCGISLYDDW